MFEFKAKDFVPKFILADKNGAALAAAIQAGMNYMNEKIADAVDVLLDVDTMPVWRLNELAWEYDLQLYPLVPNKRALIKNANRDSKIFGTREYLKNALEYGFGEGSTVNILEWHEYEGEPYNFKVEITLPAASQDVPDETDIVALSKNARSYCEEITLLGNT